MAETGMGQQQKKSWKLLTLAIVFAVLAGLGTIVYLRVLEHRLAERLKPAPQAMTSVVVAAENLSAGTIVNSDSMAIRRVPTEYVNSDAITPAEFDSVTGAVLVKPLGKGKILSEDYFDLKIPKDFSGTIKVGHRAMTIQVDEVDSISGMVRPGNFIDLYTRLASNTFPSQGADGGQNPRGKDLVIPVLEDVLVLATDHRAARPNEDEYKQYADEDRHRTYNTLTLEVTPKEAALLSIAESRGTLIATLRNPGDTQGVLFGGITTSDLLHHSMEMLQEAASKQHNRTLDGVRRNAAGQLVTKDGLVLKDQDLQLDANGLVRTRDGKILSGRDLVVAPDGTIRTRNGDEVDPEKLVAGKGGTLIDKDGNVLPGNGYTHLKGGFLEDKDGNVLTPDGHILSGVTVDKDGKVHAQDGRVLDAADVEVAKDGTVHVKDRALADLHLNDNGQLVDADDNPVAAGDLVTVGADGVVRTRDGKVLKGVTMGKDGQLYGPDGKKMNEQDILLAAQGLHKDKDGNLVDGQGNRISAEDLVTVDKDGTVRTRDGEVLDGVYMDKDGVLRNKDGAILSAADIATKEEALSLKQAGLDQQLAGVTGKTDPKFIATVLGQDQTPPSQPLRQYEVEYIVGGSGGDGTAKTFKVVIDDSILPKQSK